MPVGVAPTPKVHRNLSSDGTALIAMYSDFAQSDCTEFRATESILLLRATLSRRPTTHLLGKPNPRCIGTLTT
jgi:hypothetical protein